jgi:hypothetical protein
MDVAAGGLAAGCGREHGNVVEVFVAPRVALALQEVPQRDDGQGDAAPSIAQLLALTTTPRGREGDRAECRKEVDPIRRPPELDHDLRLGELVSRRDGGDVAFPEGPECGVEPDGVCFRPVVEEVHIAGESGVVDDGLSADQQIANAVLLEEAKESLGVETEVLPGHFGCSLLMRSFRPATASRTSGQFLPYTRSRSLRATSRRSSGVIAAYWAISHARASS